MVTDAPSLLARPLSRPCLVEYQRIESRSQECWEESVVKVRNSLKSLKRKDGSIVVRRRGRTFVVNKSNPRWKARQG